MAAKVILFSGGLDSTVGLYLLGPGWQPVYVEIGTEYGWRERNVIQSMGVKAAYLWGGRLRVIEQQSGFIPQRNLLFLTLAQAFLNADEIALCAVAGEYSRDKHRKFFAQASKLLSYTAGKVVRCFSPLQSMTKAQAVRKYLKSGGSPELLLSSVSCYDGSVVTQCGRCMSCFRRWVALESNGLVDSFDYPPWRWIWKGRSSVGELSKLPTAEIPSFLRAQLDVVRAYAHLLRRSTLRN